MMCSVSRIYLRTPKSNDVDFMLQMENDTRIWHVSETEEFYDRVDIEHFIHNSKHDLFEDGQIRYVIVLKENDRQIGSIDLFKLDAKKKSAGVGITILEDYRNKLYGKEALEALIDIAFSKYLLTELYCNIFADNKASIRLFESLGFKKIKFLEKHTVYKGKTYDEYYYRLVNQNI